MKIFLILLIGAACIGPIMSNVEEPAFSILSSEKNIQTREYDQQIVAEVLIEGERYQAINQGFKLLADYIFGNNEVNNKISMTAPVSQQSSEKIKMTAPVSQQFDGNQWIVRFVMPSQYTLLSLPKPLSSLVKIKEVPSKKFVVIKFAGKNSQKNIQNNQEKLMSYCLKNNIETIGKPIYAFYNPPWTMPMFRRNEVMVEIK